MRITDYPMLEEIMDEYRELHRSGHGRAESEQILMERYAPEKAQGRMANYAYCAFLATVVY